MSISRSMPYRPPESAAAVLPASEVFRRRLHRAGCMFQPTTGDAGAPHPRRVIPQAWTGHGGSWRVRRLGVPESDQTLPVPSGGMLTSNEWPPSRPVMGYNTWYQFRTAITESIVVRQAELMVSSGR